MRERIIAAVVTAIVHNRKTTAAGLAAVLGIAAARLGLDVSDEALVYAAGFVILVVTAAAGDSHHRSSRRGDQAHLCRK